VWTYSSIISYIGARKGRLVYIDELGKMDDLPRAREGGYHGGRSTFINLFYSCNVTDPPTTPGCNDNLGMVEFGNAIRF
jgi:hypothetical protein